MLNKIIDFSVRNKLIIGLLVLALIGIGIYQVGKLPIDAVPDITDNQVQVITVAPSYGALDIERQVTFPIEQVCNNIAGLKLIRSFSRFGLSLVTIVFQDDVDIYWARQQVSERLQQVQNQIPKGIGIPELGPISTGLGEIYQYVVRAKKGYARKYNSMELRTIQDWIIRRQLLGVKGVAEVSSFGGKLKQFEIAIDPNKLNALGISIDDVFQALEKNNQNTGGAYIEKGPTVLYIRSEGLLKKIEDIQQIAIEKTGLQTPLYLRDVADIRIGYATRYGAMCYNDEGEVSGGIVMMLKGANSSKVIKEVKQRIEEIQKTLPKGVVIEPFLDRTKMVNNAISTVEKNLLEGALIVVFILVIFLGNLRAGFLVASVIPLAMLFAICLMNLFGVSGNLMSLGALDFGLIVDGAVIIVESVMHYIWHNQKYQKQQAMNQSQMDSLVTTSAKKMMNSAVFGQLVILIVYLPIFTLEGIEGKMFKPMAQTVAFALLGAFILSLTYIPMMTTLVLSHKSKHAKNFSDRMMEKLEYLFSRKLLQLIRIHRWLLVGVFLAFMFSVILLLKSGGEFIPALEEGDFAVDTRVLTGSNLNTTIAYTQKAAHILKQRFPEVEKVVTKIGSGEVPTDPMPMEASDMMVILKDKSEWSSAKTFPELEEKMGKALEEIPGITAGFQFPVQMRFNELMTGARQDVVCKIYGENLDTLSKYAEQLSRLIRSIQGTENLYLESVLGMPQLEIQYKRAMLAQYHVSVEAANRAVHTAFAGQSAGLFFEDEKRFDIVVRMAGEKKSNLNDIRNMLISCSNGNQIPLQVVADVSIKNGINQIQRESARRRIVVGFNIKDRDVQRVVEELKTLTNQKFILPSGYSIAFGGSFENLEQAKKRLSIAVPISLILIFIFLYFAFRNVSHALLIYSAIPLSAIGGILFLFLRGMPFSISAGIGFIALFGVAVLNGIVLIAEFNRLKDAGFHNLPRIVMRGCKTRLRPVLMTALVASLGFLPMAISNGSGAEVQRPLATVVIGGLLLATLLTLFVLPILYILLQKMSLKKIMKHKVTLIGITVVLFHGTIHAQRTMSYHQACDSAIHNNLRSKQEHLKTAWQQLQGKALSAFPKTQFTTEVGQINSAYFDTKFSVQQSFAFPIIYKQQRAIARAMEDLSVQEKYYQEYILCKKIHALFLQYKYVLEKETLLHESDSMFNVFLEKASVRLSLGETNLLEKIILSNQKSAIRNQLTQLETDKKILLLELQYVTNTLESYLPEINTIPFNEPSTYSEQPQISIAQKWIQVEKEKQQAETLLRLPEWNVGLSNTSFKGVGPNNINYTDRNRFTSFQAGLSLPLFRKSIKAKIAAAATMVTIAQQVVSIQEQDLQMQTDSLQERKISLDKIILNFEQEQLPNVEKIVRLTTQQFYEDELSFLDFSLFIQQSIQTKSIYLDFKFQQLLLQHDIHFPTLK